MCIRDRFNWTDHRLYRHQNSINDYYSHGYPLGFWAGPHAQELYLNYSFRKFNSNFSIIFSDAKRGELTTQMLEDQYNNIDYDRFSNLTESLSIALCKIDCSTIEFIILGIGVIIEMVFNPVNLP